MRFFFKSFQRRDYALAIVIVIAYLCLLFQTYLISSDDCCFRFSQDAQLFDGQYHSPVNDFKTLILSNCYGYLHSNGRFLVHCFVQGFLGWLGYGAFYVCSALCLFLVLMSIIYLVRRNANILDGDVIWCLSAAALFIPLWATSFYGTVAMGVNYMWSVMVYCFFLCVYFHIKEDNVHYALWQNILLGLFGFVCGSWQESFCIGIAGALCLYHLFTLRNTNKSLLYLLIGFGFGAAVLVFAPSNFSRMGAESTMTFDIQTFSYNAIQLFKHNFFISFWIVLGIISILIDMVRYKHTHFVRENWLFFSSGLLTLCFTMILLATGAMQGIWQLTILGVWDVILLVRFLSMYCSDWLNQYSKIFVSILSICLLVLYGVIFHYRHIMKQEVDAFQTELMEHKSDTIYDGHLQYVINKVVPSHPFLFDKICPMYVNFYNIDVLKRMTIFLTEGSSCWGTTIMPEPKDSIVARCIPENGMANDIFMAPLGYVIVCIPHGQSIDDMQLVIRTTSKYPFDRFKDLCRHRPYKEHQYALSSLPSIEDLDYTFYIKYIDWWSYHDKKVFMCDLTSN